MSPQPRNEPPAPEPTLEPAPAPEPSSDEPDWARTLRETIEGLPGKLRAVITDEDRRSIAEGVHDLFERSGAFLRGEPESEPEPEPGGEPEPEPANPSDDPPERQTIAERIGFPKW